MSNDVFEHKVFLFTFEQKLLQLNLLVNQCSALTKISTQVVICHPVESLRSNRPLK